MATAQAGAQQTSGHDLDAYNFIIGSSVDRETVDRAQLIAKTWGVDPHEAMLALGWIAPEDYVAKLAAALQVDHVLGERPTKPVDAIDATAQMPSDVARQVSSRRLRLDDTHLTTGFRPDAALTHKQRRRRSQRVVNRLRAIVPILSAASPRSIWQPVILTISIGSLIGAAFVDRPLAYFILTFLAAIPFFFVVAQRLTTFFVYWWHPRPKHSHSLRTGFGVRHPSNLPIYSLLIPLFREAAVLPDILSAVTQLDYPAAKLDVILVLEESDLETQHCAAATDLPGFVRLLVVPDMHPRTKPKALNYAMQFTQGEFVVVYDAEDFPAPDQLTAALSVFDRHPQIDCLQAQLSIHNADESWLTTQFALEYAALFGGLLPALERMQVPMPLGGTSNHFRRNALLASGMWDPFNVTEDADLGI
ncbi:MAG: glycosyltransferase, partial [Pseudomonadota bacterium]